MLEMRKLLFFLPYAILGIQYYTLKCEYSVNLENKLITSVLSHALTITKPSCLLHNIAC